MTSTLTWMLYATLRNPVTAVALPLIFGTLSGSGTRKTVRSEWYQVSSIHSVCPDGARDNA
jgi:benzodiazapine receptor